MVTPAYKINGVALPTPRECQWQAPQEKGIRGDGTKLYNPYYSVEIRWMFLTATEYALLYTTWQGTYNSGTATVDLPQYKNATYQFHQYSGTIIDMPDAQNPLDYEYYPNVKMTIRKITVV